MFFLQLLAILKVHIRRDSLLYAFSKYLVYILFSDLCHFVVFTLERVFIHLLCRLDWVEPALVVKICCFFDAIVFVGNNCESK